LTGSEHLLNDTWGMKHLLITRNKLKQITGFEVNSWRVMHLKFIKTQYNMPDNINQGKKFQ
jgi:hypothetical protein